MMAPSKWLGRVTGLVLAYFWWSATTINPNVRKDATHTASQRKRVTYQAPRQAVISAMSMCFVLPSTE
jgi:hypothetical protein